MRTTGIVQLQTNLGVKADGNQGPVTLQALAKFMAPGAPDGVGQALHATGAQFSRRGLIHFMANIAHESGFHPLAENLNYSAERLLQVWPSRFLGAENDDGERVPSLAVARLYAYKPQALANYVYANRMGNGPPSSGDGYRFRGRGWPQLTGRDAYRTVGLHVARPFEAEPESLLTLEGSALAAVGFWRWKSCAIPAERDDTTAVRKRWNGGTIGLRDVQKIVDRTHAIWPA